ncbi:MAG: hypothetical protein F4Y00_02020 [Bacteroidetes bacterium SB0662_bin_6]|nr:hypothetical protein [Bacteroidetes bacterium SB0668_bin_1]MYE03740.1 hypothetical protein [Bacteroidetes bacterium SB0662_bin_6]
MPFRTLFLGCLTAGFLLLPAAHSARAQQVESRSRDWSYREVGRWLERLSVSGSPAANNVCPDFTNRRDAIMNGNKITTQITNFGSISSPGNTITDIVWNGLGYGYEFGPFVGAEIVDPNREDPQSVPKRDENGRIVLDAAGDTVYVMHIVSDGLASNGGEISPDGRERWGWQPIPCAQPVGSFAGIQVVNAESRLIPTSDDRDKDLDGKPDPWPEDWYNVNLAEYVWPGALQQGASNADKEALYFMNDYSNREYAYLPFPGDSTRKGLGLEVETRLYQWSNPLAEDAIFLVYKITNKSEKNLERVRFGMWGDPHVGGPSDWHDDLADFDTDLNMVYAWDDDGRSDVAGRPPGYFGYKFLESPGRGRECIDGSGADAATCEASGGTFFPGDGVDNDGDGMLDESWTDGLDNDEDWDPETDDVGIDGVPGTGDQGEGDGMPTAGSQFDITKPGEPNFEFTDIDESDMIGLTSFASPPFGGNNISNDQRVWGFVEPGRFDDIPTEPGDYVFIYGAGDFPLRAGETKRFSIALLVGENLEDLRLNARTVQQIYDVGYRFAKPPRKPLVQAVPGDKKVTLYWGTRSEDTIDPLTREADFEGYVIYRSTDHEFADQQTITDVNGTKFLFRPLTDERGVEAKFDLDNGVTGPSPIPFADRGIAYDLGDDTGLFHTYVDSNNVRNGQTYYYAVSAYDRGYAGNDVQGFSGGIPPTETSKTITYNPTTDEYVFDVNAMAVVPRPPAAGYVAPSIQLDHTEGVATGDLEIVIVDAPAIADGNPYRIDFDKDGARTVYTVTNELPRTVTVTARPGQFSGLGHKNIVADSFTLRTEDGRMLEAGSEYVLYPEAGSVEILSDANIEAFQRLVASFLYAPIYQSGLLQKEEGNPVFEGLHVFIQDHVLEIDAEQTGWTQGNAMLPFEVRVASAGPGRRGQPSDYEIRFDDATVMQAFVTNLDLPFEIVNLTKANESIRAFVPDANRNGVWDLNEAIIFVENIDGRDLATWQVRFPVEAGGDAEPPGAGDVFFIRTNKPFADEDTYTFRTAAAGSDPALAREALDNIYVVPNPYVATNEIEPRNPIANTERGDRRLYFANVPKECTIRIYTLAGELVDTIEHSSAVDDGKVFWDLRTRDNMNIAYGLYIFHVDAPEGSAIGKFAVIK